MTGTPRMPFSRTIEIQLFSKVTKIPVATEAQRRPVNRPWMFAARSEYELFSVIVLAAASWFIHEARTSFFEDLLSYARK